MSSSVRISQTSWQILRQIATQAGEPMQAVLDKAIESYRRQYFLLKANEAYAALRENAEAWQEELEERVIWDAAVKDGEINDG